LRRRNMFHNGIPSETNMTEKHQLKNPSEWNRKKSTNFIITSYTIQYRNFPIKKSEQYVFNIFRNKNLC
jgi:hypothetical protein